VDLRFEGLPVRIGFDDIARQAIDIDRPDRQRRMEHPAVKG